MLNSCPATDNQHSLSASWLKGFLLSAFLLLATNGQAASFDCDKAQSTVERMICAEPELSHLDEQLAARYRSVREALSDQGALKSEQLDWLKERNHCYTKACLVMRYRERIARLEQLAGEDEEPEGKPRYRLVAGKGYSICETFLKHLNSLPTNAPPMICNIRPNPAYNAVTRDDWDITQPDWEALDVQENLHLIYAAEMEYPPYSVYRYDQDKELPTFEEWKADFDARISAGKIHPKLYRTRLALNEEGRVETLIGYEPEPEACERNLPKYEWSTRSGGKHIFVFNDDPEEPVKTIHGNVGSDFLLTVLRYRGKYYFAWGGGDGPKKGFIQISIPSSGTLLNHPKEYVLQFRCEYEIDR